MAAVDQAPGPWGRPSPLAVHGPAEHRERFPFFQAHPCPRPDPVHLGPSRLTPRGPTGPLQSQGTPSPLGKRPEALTPAHRGRERKCPVGQGPGAWSLPLFTCSLGPAGPPTGPTWHCCSLDPGEAAGLPRPLPPSPPASPGLWRAVGSGEGHGGLALVALPQGQPASPQHPEDGREPHWESQPAVPLPGQEAAPRFTPAHSGH